MAPHAGSRQEDDRYGSGGHGRGNVVPPGSWHHMWVHGRKATVTAAEVTAAGVTAAGLDNTSLGVISRQGHGSVCHGRCPFKKYRFL